MPPFVSGLDLAESFYREVIQPRLAGIVHSAALIGTGSEVLGYDDARSTDHGWGPRLQVFVADGDVEPARHAVEPLPDHHRGWPTRIGSAKHPYRTQVDVWTVTGWMKGRLGVDPRDGLSTVDWLALPQQLLLEMTAGRVFHDGSGELEPIRALLTWYPNDVWLWSMAAQWGRIAEEEAFIGRTAEAGDDLGSRVVAARLVRDVMRLCFLQEKAYAPYSKWLGTAFARLDAAGDVGPYLAAALEAGTYAERERALNGSYEAVAGRHNRLGLTHPVEPTVRPFHDRPFQVIGGDRFASACLEAVTDTALRSLPLVGAVDQWVDSTLVLGYAERARCLAEVYRRLG